ncbi:MAG TPA: SOS response-associated peptidase [Caldisericia bacterium]|nr:SOS response-associated peptidase [Caldisericia bacterium]HPI84599.1 SOS response-associated peptidase [Caldisericia bacterium]HPQ92986.1 SOS response-associated peptidase [Caldisericia bacterium]
MCGRITLTHKLEEIYKRFKVDLHGEYDEIYQAEMSKPRYNIAPSQHITCITSDRKLEYMKWGLVPSWATDSSIGYKTFNARAETVDTKPAFRASFAKRRCLIPVSGFYEWKREGKKKSQPFLIGMKSGELFALAGLWDSWKSPDGVELKSCTIITTTPNEMMKPIHDRMPVILQQEFEDEWFVANIQAAKRLLRPFDVQSMLDIKSVSIL